MAEAMQQEQDRKRSPGYPTIDLKEAIEKAQVLYDEDKGSPATTEVIAAHWKSKTSSSAFMQWLASLKRYGLLVEASNNGSRQLKLSPAAMDILLLPPEDPRHIARIKEAALMPKPFADLWQEHGMNLPSDANLRHKLITTKGFKPDSASDLIKRYKKTLEFAKLSESDKVSEDEPPDNHQAATGKTDGGLFTGDPFRSFPAQGRATDAPPKKPDMQGDMKQDVFNLDEGPVVLQWPTRLSPESYADLKDWMELQLRKIGRAVTKETSESDPDNSSDA